jgi:hypothetical protein
MSEITRRNAMVSAGAIGLIGLSANAIRGQEKSAKAADLPALSALVPRLKLTDEEYKKAGVILTPENAPVAFITPKAAKEGKSLEPDVVELMDANEQRIAYALQWTCPTNVINLFTVGGAPFVVTRFTFSTSNVSWQAGNGWPVYTTYCPRGDYHTSMYYPHAKIHQIVPSIVGQNYFIGCLSSAICESPAPGQVAFAVNDGTPDYGDNRGTFTIVITNWS